MKVPTTRFAPSPTGRLHAGHAYAAWFAQEAAQPAGRFLLRIEDIDAGRCRPAFTEGIFEDLQWLGLGWDGPPLVQSARMAVYAQALERLREEGLLYPCFCTRAEVRAALTAPHAGPDGAPLYPGTCRALPPSHCEDRVAAGESHAWRLDIALAVRRTGPLSWREDGENFVAKPDLWGDVVLGRRDVPASYHLAATLDDAAQGITLVTRGEDLRPAAALHRLLQATFGWPEPHYRHHRLLTDAADKRLAKRAGAPTIADWRAAGLSPTDCLARVRELQALC